MLVVLSFLTPPSPYSKQHVRLPTAEFMGVGSEALIGQPRCKCPGKSTHFRTGHCHEGIFKRGIPGLCVASVALQHDVEVMLQKSADLPPFAAKDFRISHPSSTVWGRRGCACISAGNPHPNSK